jgi:hypothetical protein
MRSVYTVRSKTKTKHILVRYSQRKNAKLPCRKHQAMKMYEGAEVQLALHCQLRALVTWGNFSPVPTGKSGWVGRRPPRDVSCFSCKLNADSSVASTQPVCSYGQHQSRGAVNQRLGQLCR